MKSRLNRPIASHRFPFVTAIAAGFLLCCSYAYAQFSYRSLTDPKPGYYDIKAKFPEFQANTPLTRLANTSIRNWVKQGMADFAQAFQDYQRDPDRLDTALPWQYWVTCDVTYLRNNHLVSIRCHIFEYSGGAHPMEYYEAFNYGVFNGQEKRLSLSDFFPASANFRQVTADVVTSELKSYAEKKDLRCELEEMSEKQLNRFVLAPKEVHFLFDRCEICACYEGEPDLKVNLKNFGPDFGRNLLIGR